MSQVGKITCMLLAILGWGVQANAESKYVRQKESNRQAIVFVHGILGNSIDTWTDPATQTYWPNLLVQDKDFDGTDIFVVDYPSPKIEKSLSIDELAEHLRLTLDSHGVIAAHSEIIFVAHSMGGLITRAYLSKYRETAKKVKLLYFFATPTTGAAIASIVSLASANPQFTKLMPMTSDGYLADVQRAWLAANELTILPSFCAYELQRTRGVMIVEQYSATNLCNRRLDPIDRNHLDIVKPRARNDVPYMAFKSAYIGDKTSRQSMLRMESQNITQIRKPIKKQPEFQKQLVYCDSVRLTLVLAHSQDGEIPILVHSIAVHSEPVRETEALRPGACEVDRLSSKPYGIVETDTFVITASDQGALHAKLIKNALTASEVHADNILRSSSNVRTVTLKRGEEPVAFDVLIDVKSSTPQRVWFSAHYDEDGERAISTIPFIVSK